MDGDTYPMPPEYEGEISLNLPQSVLGIDTQTIFAVGNDEQKDYDGCTDGAQQASCRWQHLMVSEWQYVVLL